LTCAIQCAHPFNALGRKQLGTGLSVVDDVHVVQNTGLDDPHSINPAERVTIPEKRGSAILAKATGDRLASVGRLADLLWFPLGDLEVGGGDDNIIGIVAAGDLAAVGTVAERCHGRLARVLDFDAFAEATSGWHAGQR